MSTATRPRSGVARYSHATATCSHCGEPYLRSTDLPADQQACRSCSEQSRRDKLLDMSDEQLIMHCPATTWYKVHSEYSRTATGTVKRCCIGSKPLPAPLPKGVYISSTRAYEQTTVERVAVDGVVVYERVAHHGQGRDSAWRMACKHRLS